MYQAEAGARLRAALAAVCSLGAQTVICTSKNKLIVIFNLHKGKGGGGGIWEGEGSLALLRHRTSSSPAPVGLTLPVWGMTLGAEGVDSNGDGGTGPSSSPP